ncbi:MAG: nucleoside deaminase [Coriobacteriales bacterium]|jgi:tRNA(adenine34) deaminase|nr:nucleoside deaminase [Coriobacteriales bacterium]
MADTHHKDDYFMRRALEQAELAAAAGEVPVGAVVVSKGAPDDPGRVVAAAHNRRETDTNPAAHAEFLAILAAARTLGRWRLSDCTVYVTLEPCVMCAGLMHQARIARCVFAARDPKAGALGSLYQINEDTRLNHTFEVSGGVGEQQSANLLSSFFAELRARG